MADAPDTHSTKSTPERTARPTVPWRVVFAAFFLTFLAMAGAIYWVIRTGKL